MKKSKWTSKPSKKGWYWVRIKGAKQVCAAGFILRLDTIWYFDCGYNLQQIEYMWHHEFHPVTPPK